MAVVKLTDRQFSEQTINNLDRSIFDAFEDLKALKRINCPEWTDDSSGDFGIQLLWLYSVLHKFLIDYVNQVTNNCYLQTVADRASLQRILKLIDYDLGQAVPASVLVTFTLEDGHPEFTIPKGTQVSTESTPDQDLILFETSQDILVTAGLATIDINCVQGYTIIEEIIGSSDGTADQRFRCLTSPVIHESETVEVKVEDSWQTWIRVDDFVESSGDSLHYRVELDNSGRYYIVFGDGVNGRIPASGTNNIRCTYRVGGGAEGNIPADTIKELVSDLDYVEAVSNSSAASGGADPETIAHARKFAPASLRSLERAVSAGDYKYLAESYVSAEYGAIAKAAALEIGLSVEVRIVPASGGLPPQGLKDELRAYLVERRTACTGLEVADPVYNYVDIILDLYIQTNYNRDSVINAVRSSLASLLSPAYQDPETGLYPHEFGRDVYLSDLYHTIESVSGVDRCDISEPTANVTIENNEIADIGTLNITAHQGGETKSYLDLEI